LRREIEAADYMAITSRRIAMQSEVITGRRDTEEAQRFRERATTYEDQSKELRQQYRDIAAERAMRNEPTKNHQPAPERDSPTSTVAKTQDHELSRGEITDGKAERIARIREQAKEFTSNENARQNSLGRDPGGRSR
jgi:chromatin segregation and condensation protein Rec8/ScpA/Scc1 (kleisin family)